MKRWSALFILMTAAMSLQAGERSLTLDLVPGENWIGTGHIGPIEITVEPSFAVWLEDGNGKFLDTVYVTEKVAKSKWNGTVGRHEVLPVWGHARGIENSSGYYLPSKTSPMADTVTSPTPLEAFTWDFTLPEDLPEGSYTLYFEINLSFDFNETWTKGRTTSKKPYRNKVNGQPSLVYAADITVDEEIKTGDFILEGAGSSTGKEGGIFPVEGVDSAADLIKSLSLK